MAALDFIVSVASNTFVPTYDGNMAKLVEGHRRYVNTLTRWDGFLFYKIPKKYTPSNYISCRYLGFKKSILLDRKRLVELLDMHLNGTLSWNEFSVAVRSTHEKRMGQPTRRRVIADKPKEEDYFYANPQECLCEGTNCDNLRNPSNSSEVG